MGTRTPQPLGALPWAGETIVCVAAGPSGVDADLSIARGRARVIVVNESWRLAPWADLLYACDGKWWEVAQPDPAAFAGLRVTQDNRAARLYGLRTVELTRGQDRILTDRPGALGWGGNGGFHALNIAAQSNPGRILLVAFDFQGEHWHGRHAKGLNNPAQASLARWARTLDAQAPAFAALGIHVVNCSPDSALTAYPKTTLRTEFA